MSRSVPVYHSIVEGGPYLADGTNKFFPFTIPFLSPGDLVVMTTNTTTGAVTQLTLNTDYTVLPQIDSLARRWLGPAPAVPVYCSGGVVFTTAPSGVTVTIARRTAPRTQPLEFTTDGAFPVASWMTASQRLLYLIQEKGAHFQGYTDGAPSLGNYWQDDFMRMRSAPAGSIFEEAYNLANGDPGTWTLAE